MEIVWGAKGQHGLSGDQTAHVDLSLAEMWAFQVMPLKAQWIGEDVSGSFAVGLQGQGSHEFRNLVMHHAFHSSSLRLPCGTTA